MRKIGILLVVMSMLACNTPEVLVLPTLHGAHELNDNYTYDDLMQIAKAFDPDVIGVEIRPVDMEMNSDSLDKFYPIEMINIRDSFPGKVTGIDFYSESSEQIPVHREMFTDTASEMGKLKKLQNDMKKDPVLMSRFESSGLPEIYEAQKKMALNSSANDFLKGEYDSLSGRQYSIEDRLYKNTFYEDYSRFNNNRDLQITQNALELIRRNSSKKILILVGANHRNRLMDSLQNKKIKIISDLRFMKK